MVTYGSTGFALDSPAVGQPKSAWPTTAASRISQPAQTLRRPRVPWLAKLRGDTPDAHFSRKPMHALTDLSGRTAARSGWVGGYNPVTIVPLAKLVWFVVSPKEERHVLYEVHELAVGSRSAQPRVDACRRHAARRTAGGGQAAAAGRGRFLPRHHRQHDRPDQRRQGQDLGHLQPDLDRQ